MEKTFRIFDFNVYNEDSSIDDSSESSNNGIKKYHDSANFLIQIFGLDETGKTCSIIVEEFKPFFYLLINDSWNLTKKNAFLNHLKEKMGKFYENSITDCIIVKRKKLYGFDGGKEHKFIKLEFTNMNAFNKAKNLWYSAYNNSGIEGDKENGRKLLKNGYLFEGTFIKIYESNIPPLLRFFHIQNISPSGWIALPFKKTIQIKQENKKTNCDFEFIINYKYIVSLNDNEIRVPYKICSFDIEASSSHGDFPVPIKSYKKLATNIIEYFENNNILLNEENSKKILKEIILAAFGFIQLLGIDLVYPKNKTLSLVSLESLFEKWITFELKNAYNNSELQELNTIDKIFEKMASLNHEEEEDIFGKNNEFNNKNKYKNSKKTIIEILCDSKLERENKLNELNLSLNAIFPRLEGDKVTFIGSTFTKYGESEPYFNHCISLNTCSKLPSENTFIESYASEKEVLLAWRDLIQKENPDIIIGYNIFGFDYEFMFRRAEENNCIEDFLQLSRNKNEICANKNRDTGKYQMEETSIQIASGQHDLKYIKMNGRLQVDLYNFFRREENLTSYKLDYVAGYFIGDYIKNLEYIKNENDIDSKTKIKTGNMTGLLVDSFVHLEEIGHSVDYYDNGAKYKVLEVNKKEGYFILNAHVKPDINNKKVRWCLAKDDVTPKDIFRMTNGTAEERAVIAKYCIQDCNLVHYLFNKADILTGFIEMSKICSVPINFLVLRGQGIKLTSYIAKKCREKRTLMPVIEKGGLDEGYEGAIVLDPKCDLYLDNPVACVDYASLYPSSMISENLSHDSKVWTREYDLAGNLIEETGEKDEKGEFLYDNLPGFEYVNITYDTYRYIRKTPTSAAEKVKSGQKTCRFEQGKAIMPSILEELLKARKDTRKMIPLEKDEFMKNVLDKRQLGYKVTANSLYGQCGAKTSTFYEKDIAACTTATGRMLLTYAKRVIEECYGDSICNTKVHGQVLTKAEYIYGDSVANYTPIYVSFIENNERKIDILTIENLAEKYGNNNWISCIEPGKQEKEFCELSLGLETWTENGWTKLYRVIRHKLASHKKIIRILTHTGLVDVTDDHSLIAKEGIEISPKDIQLGSELLHFKNPINNSSKSSVSEDEARIMGFFFGDGSCGEYECPSGKKKSWALNNSSMEIINKYLQLCKNVYPMFEWVVMPTLESSGVYKISPRCSREYGSICVFVKKYRSILYYEKCKIIPNEILNSDVNIKLAFFEGLYDADGDKDINGYTRIDQKNQISASHICLLAQSLGFSTSINTRKDKENIYRITMTKKKQRKNVNAVKKMNEIKYQGYVYDLTTENHHFAAGIGNLIVHNTDSVFFTFNLQTPEGKPIRGKEALEITIELAQEAGHLASSFLKGPHDLEYEKTFMPFCLLSKKRYVGMLYETDPNKCKRKEMGIVLKRRDNAPIVKDIYGGIIDILMKQQNIQQATEFLKSCLQNMVDEKYPMDKLIITKSLRSGYKNPQSIAHKVLADRITARDPGNKPSSGDRIPFVYINNSNKNALQGEKIETPTFIVENRLKIDYSFYITNQIMKPVQQVFALVLEKIWKMQKKESKLVSFKKEIESLKKMYKDEPEKLENKIEQIRNKEVKTLLFDKYLRETNNEKEGNQSLTKFFKK
jgi:DNA polymerase elongation subunit (family B)